MNWQLSIFKSLCRAAPTSAASPRIQRDLLMACGLLPVIDKQIRMFERWLAKHLVGISNLDHSQISRPQAHQPGRTPVRW